MPRKSTIGEKTPFQKRREDLGLSREKAAEILDGISCERLYSIEHGKARPTPEDILAMADGYKDPTLCNAIFIASNRLVGILPILRVVTISRTTTCLAGSFNFVNLTMLKFRSSPSDIFNIHVLTPNR